MVRILYLFAAFFSATIVFGDKPDIVSITNNDGITIEAQVISVVRSEDNLSWLCFRKPGGKTFFLYPFSSISRFSLDLLSEKFPKDQLIVVDGLTGPQIDRLEEYLAAEPRERLVLELRDAKRNERLLEREWNRLQDQTWQIQKQLTRTQTPEQRQLVGKLFHQSLRARDRVGKQLSLLRVEIRRLEDRIALLQSIGIPIDDDPFSDP